MDRSEIETIVFDLQFLVFQPEELRNAFHEILNKTGIETTLEEATKIYDGVVVSESFKDRIQKELDNKDDSSLHYALYHCRWGKM